MTQMQHLTPLVTGRKQVGPDDKVEANNVMDRFFVPSTGGTISPLGHAFFLS